MNRERSILCAGASLLLALTCIVRVSGGPAPDPVGAFASRVFDIAVELNRTLLLRSGHFRVSFLISFFFGNSFQY